mmetsp:Transcript_8935/g.37521  ORF Transcript_8935/g.37521 Transcript_8935/m.37521 type:complete len:203 (-) Transcript_8935:1441-2049(-)
MKRLGRQRAARRVRVRSRCFRSARVRLRLRARTRQSGALSPAPARAASPATPRKSGDASGRATELYPARGLAVVSTSSPPPSYTRRTPRTRPRGREPPPRRSIARARRGRARAGPERGEPPRLRERRPRRARFSAKSCANVCRSGRRETRAVWGGSGRRRGRGGEHHRGRGPRRAGGGLGHKPTGSCARGGRRAGVRALSKM